MSEPRVGFYRYYEYGKPVKVTKDLLRAVQNLPPGRIEIMRTGLNWTTDKPTKAGWYWFRGRVNSGTDTRTLRTQPYRVDTNEFWGKGGLALYEADYLIFGVNELIGEWAGPLEEPPL